VTQPATPQLHICGPLGSTNLKHPIFVSAATLPRLYLCGPMTGLPQFNHPNFMAAARLLRRTGYEVFNPAENSLPNDAPWAEHMRVDIRALMDCEAVATLPDCEGSKGAQLEQHIANALGMQVLPWIDWIKHAAAAEAEHLATAPNAAEPTERAA
jgi:hypothetical protein